MVPFNRNLIGGGDPRGLASGRRYGRQRTCSPTPIFLVFRISAVEAAVTLPGVFGAEVNYELECKDFSARANFSRAKDLKLSTTGARVPSRTAIPISDIGIRSTMSQATTEATLCLTADKGKMATPMWASTSEISVESSAAVWEILGTILASRSIPKIRSWNPGA